jgi:hypothetical protein
MAVIEVQATDTTTRKKETMIICDLIFMIYIAPASDIFFQSKSDKFKVTAIRKVFYFSYKNPVTAGNSPAHSRIYTPNFAGTPNAPSPAGYT